MQNELVQSSISVWRNLQMQKQYDVPLILPSPNPRWLNKQANQLGVDMSHMADA
jgi:hypothetical protein